MDPILKLTNAKYNMKYIIFLRYNKSSVNDDNFSKFNIHDVSSLKVESFNDTFHFKRI